MSPEGMGALVSSSSSDPSSPAPSADKTISMAEVDTAISEALTSSNGNSDKVKLHLATADDLHHIERLVDGLAVFDKEEGAIHVNGDHYRVDGFQGDEPMFKCILIENKEDNEICGMAFFYFGYDVEKGRFLYLEDLFVDEQYRGRGYGSLFMTTLAGVAKNVGCTGFVWQALDWSTGALNFYDKIGGKVLDGRLTTRFNGDALRNFVDTRPSNV
jgi:GNAT superfamily N-acetyltransferase